MVKYNIAVYPDNMYSNILTVRTLWVNYLIISRELFPKLFLTVIIIHNENMFMKHFRCCFINLLAIIYILPAGSYYNNNYCCLMLFFLKFIFVFNGCEIDTTHMDVVNIIIGFITESILPQNTASIIITISLDLEIL